MKTTKFFMLVALLSIATLTFSQKTDDQPQVTVKITLKCALQDQYLVKAMRAQLNPGFLNENEGSRIYTAVIHYRHIRYVIYGTKPDWKAFFAVLPIDPTPER